jgi:hypothetical protein
LDSTIFPTQVDLFLQGDDSVGQPIGGYTDSYQALLFQGVNLVSQSSDMREFERSGFLLQVPGNSVSRPKMEGRLGSWFS